ncbi:4-hydroxy-tetrahydrodipicolinate reductase, partial [Haemophilus influenzae]|jgi:hypothetical protein
MTLK